LIFIKKMLTHVILTCLLIYLDVFPCHVSKSSLQSSSDNRHRLYICKFNYHTVMTTTTPVYHTVYIAKSYALFLFLFLIFKDMHYNTMIRTFCILKKMTFSAFHYLTLSVCCEELDAHNCIYLWKAHIVNTFWRKCYRHLRWGRFWPLFHVQIVFFRNSFFRHLNKALII
jgi:hypothetical protein